MKFIVVALLAVCLTQGSHAQFGRLGRLFSGATDAAKDAATGALNVAKDAASTAADLSSKLSGSAKGVLDAAAADLTPDQLSSKVKNLTPEEMLETLNAAAAQITQRVEEVKDKLQTAISTAVEKAETTAKAAVQEATSSWNKPVQTIAQKAADMGIDVTGCGVTGVADLGVKTASGAVKCITDKITEAAKLAKDIVELPIRAATLAKDGVVGYRSCESKSNFMGMRNVCRAAKLTPVVLKSMVLLKDTIQDTTKAVWLVTHLHTDLSTCATEVVVKQAVGAAALGKDIVSCVKGKMSA